MYFEHWQLSHPGGVPATARPRTCAQVLEGLGFVGWTPPLPSPLALRFGWTPKPAVAIHPAASGRRKRRLTPRLRRASRRRVWSLRSQPVTARSAVLAVARASTCCCDPGGAPATRPMGDRTPEGGGSAVACDGLTRRSRTAVLGRWRPKTPCARWAARIRLRQPMIAVGGDAPVVPAGAGRHPLGSATPFGRWVGQRGERVGAFGRPGRSDACRWPGARLLSALGRTRESHRPLASQPLAVATFRVPCGASARESHRPPASPGGGDVARQCASGEATCQLRMRNWRRRSSASGCTGLRPHSPWLWQRRIGARLCFGSVSVAHAQLALPIFRIGLRWSLASRPLAVAAPNWRSGLLRQSFSCACATAGFGGGVQ